MSNGRAFEVVVSAGSLRPPDGVVMPHRWTSEGVVVQTEFTGAHLYHLAAASCILNDVYRESDRLGFVIDGVRVCEYGGFDTSTWESSGVVYEVDVASEASDADIARLVGLSTKLLKYPRHFGWGQRSFVAPGTYGAGRVRSTWRLRSRLD